MLCHAIAYRTKMIKFEHWKLILLFLIWGLVDLAANNIILAQVGKHGELWNVDLRWSSLVSYVLFGLWYLAEMTTVECSSPSMKIITTLHYRKEKRISLEDAKTLFSDQEFVIDRLNDLVLHGHVKCDNATYTLLPRGRFIVQVFKFYRWLLDRKSGG